MSFENIKKGETIKAGDMNDLFAFARAKSTVRGTNGIRVKNLPNGTFIMGDTDEPIIGTIVCCGNCEESEGCTDKGKDCAPHNDDGCCEGCNTESFTDNRYWVVFNKINESTFCDPLNSEMRDPCTDIKWGKVVALNLAEDNCASHLLPPGTRVHLKWTRTSTAGNEVTWWFERTPMPKASVVDECTSRSCDCDSSHSSHSNSSHSSSDSSHSNSNSTSTSESHSFPSYSASSSDSHSDSNSNSNSQSNSNSTSQPSTSTPSTSLPSNSSNSNSNSNGSGSNTSLSFNQGSDSGGSGSGSNGSGGSGSNASNTGSGGSNNGSNTGSGGGGSSGCNCPAGTTKITVITDINVVCNGDGTITVEKTTKDICAVDCS